MRYNKISTLESRIARLESKVAGFYYKTVDPELLSFIKKFQKRAPDYFPGIDISISNHPNVQDSDLVLEIKYPDVQFYSGSFSDDYMYEPITNIAYMTISSTSVQPGYYEYEISKEPFFRKIITSNLIDLDMGKFLVLIKELNKKVFQI